ncbi:MAG TPA: nitrogen regulation protein NR(I) [Steroidobacteraceae bacterium]|jgi:two-component system nitrogen regulation response regulator GlnG|nr:nitrogen regulation protein NR(I) [Steroidobacteraceae bacterium]
MRGSEGAGTEPRTTGALRVWLVDDDASIRWVLERALRNSGMTARAFEAAEPALEALRREAPDVLITDIRMPGQSGLSLLRRIRETRPTLPVIVMTAHSDLGSAVSAYEGGAFEYLPKPFDIDQAVALVQRAASAVAQGTADSTATPRIPELLGTAPAMQQVFRGIGRLSRSSVTVLITGESGTGKELVARALHDHSPRAGKPFIALNTSAIPADLLESELFGHEKGSFTGADAQRRGRFEQADGGTLFLDEIGDMSTPLQTRLLRVLAEGEFYRVGGQTPIRVDVRVIAATHQNLQDRVAHGLFREDLYHRLNVIRLELPPLRARSEDIPDLFEHYLRVAARDLGVERKALAKEAESKLTSYAWPGNVRELVNLCRRLSVLAPGREIRVEDLPPEILAAADAADGELDWQKALAGWADRQALGGKHPLLDVALPAMERILIRAALRRTQGHRQEAAKLLGWGRNTLTRKLKELGMAEGETEGSPEAAEADNR